MSDSDSILSGIAIGLFSFAALNVVAYCLRRRYQRTPMKQSPSMENLNVDDPVLV